MITLIDTNVVLDVAGNDPIWADWSRLQINHSAQRGTIAINSIVYAELSVFYDRTDDVDEVLAESGILLEEIPRPALFLAGKAFQAYRKRGGTRTGVLPDFFIGAHASSSGFPLLTRDTRRYRTYFPDVTLITPHP
jgi:hypothetical protein